MKRRLLAGACGILLAALLLGGCAPEKNKENIQPADRPVESAPDTGTGVSAHGQLSVVDGKLVDMNGEPFQLKGMSTHGIGWYGQYVNAGAMKSVKAAGGNCFRAAMYTEADRGYLSDPERNTALMAEAIENARAMDMYIVVDWHILNDGDPNAHLNEAITFFDRIASSYPGDPAVIYEICNEPNGVSWEQIQQYAYAICPVIRQYSPEALVVLGTPEYSFDLSGPLTAPFPQDNILYAFHYYAGQHGDFGGLKYALEQGLPVMVSEWGVNVNGSGQPDLDAGRDFASYLNEQRVSWCAWSLCNKDEVFSALRPDCTALSGWEPEDLTEVGTVLFEALGGGGM
ncbi:MAG: glycoside hydrolase family 5 protein [Oscillospiraceae bacterium]|nr:glycoside hydrolase family 5 protein [Oscillospiraceae bacterium]